MNISEKKKTIIMIAILTTILIIYMYYKYENIIILSWSIIPVTILMWTTSSWKKMLLFVGGYGFLLNGTIYYLNKGKIGNSGNSVELIQANYLVILSLIFFMMYLRLNILKKEKQLQTATFIDSLTKIANSRFAELYMEYFQRNYEGKNELCIILFDIDNFSKVNEKYGHLYGDNILKEILGLIRKEIRNSDLIYRTNEDNFTAFLLDTGINEATDIAETIRKVIEEHTFDYNGRINQSTISIGVTKYVAGVDLKDLIENADTALQRAKKTGKNKVVVFTDK